MNKKIALCFLTYDNLSQPKLWNKFISSEKYNLYIHNKNKFICNEFGFHNHCIENRIATKWGEMSLVKATILLLKQAFLEKDNEYFILLSDTCIPLYSSQQIYSKIIQIDKSIISSDCLNRERFDGLEDKSFFTKESFMKQNQWMLLKRETVNFFIENDFTHVFGNNFKGPDEHYFVNICIKFNLPFIKRFITFVNWKEKSDSRKFKQRPKTYSHLSNSMIEDIKKEKEGTFLFMRKVSKECILPSYFDNYENRRKNCMVNLWMKIKKRVCLTMKMLRSKNSSFSLS